MSSVPKAADETLPRGSSDRASTADTLNFLPYIMVLQRFLLHANPPLTISIEGEWGAGKSSFMCQLRQRLKDQGHATVSFNPWRHQEAEEQLWAGFILQFIEQVSKRLSIRGRLRARMRLVLERSRERRNRTLLRAGVTLALYAVVVVALFLFGDETQAVLGILGVTAVSGIGLFVWIKRNVVERTENELRSYLSNAPYDERVSFIERFHDDFDQILDAYVGKNERVFVFIDDLDRCDVTKVADLIESLHLMLSDDSRLIFLLGMDREMVAGALAAKHGDVLDTLDEDTQEVYGDRYLQKLVQIPFVIPRITAKNVDEFVSGIAPTDDEGTEEHDDDLSWGTSWRYSRWERLRMAVDMWIFRLRLAAELWFRRRRLTLSYWVDHFRYDPWNLAPIRYTVRRWFERLGVVPSMSVRPEDDPDVLSLTVSGWSQSGLKSMTELAAPVLDYNPRQLKRFVNLYSLSALLSAETKPFRRARRDRSTDTRGSRERQESGSGTEPTLEQIGKFVVITLRWPRLLQELQRNPKLLSTLTLIGLRRRYWQQYSRRVAERLEDDDVEIEDDDIEVEDQSDGETDPESDDTVTVSLDDEEIQAAELAGLPSVFQSEEALAPMLELLLAKLYTDEETKSETGANLERERVKEFDTLVERFEEVFDTQVERLKEGDERSDPTWFFETLGPVKIEQTTDADMTYSLANEKVVRTLLEVSPRSPTMGEKQYQQVLEYRRAIEHNPYASWVRVDLANLLFDLGQVEEAEKQYEAALDLDQHDIYAHANYTNLLEETGRLEDAGEHYETALLQDPTDTFVRADYADLLTRQGRLEAAASQYETVLRYDPYNSYARINLADLLKSQGRLREAESHFDYLLQESPDDIYLRTNYAELLEQAGDVERAHETYEYGLSIDSSNTYLRVRYAEFLARQGLRDQAETQYREAMEEDDSYLRTTDRGDRYFALIKYAEFLAKEGRFDAARERYEATLREEPKSRTVRIAYAEFLANHGYDDEANKQYENALKELPSDGHVLLNYADFLVNQGRSAAAEEHFEKAIAVEPDDAYIRTRYASHLADRDDLGKAETFYREAVDLAPEDGIVLASYGNFLADRGRHDEAVERFRKAVTHDPYDAYVLTSYANFLADRGHTEQAEGQYLKAIEFDANGFDLTNYAAFLADRGRDDEAEETFQRVVDLGIEDEFFRVSYAEFLAERDRDDEAEQLYLDGLDEDPTNEVVLASYVDFLSDRGRADEAAMRYQEVIDHDPDRVSLYYDYGVFLDDQKRPEEAVEQYRMGLELDPDDAMLNNNYGYLLVKLGRLDDAGPYCEKAVELAPDSPHAHDTYATYLHREGELEDAAIYYQRAIALKPDDPDYHRSYAELLEDQGRDEAADREYQRARELEAESTAQD